MAAACRRTCGETRFLRNEAQFFRACANVACQQVLNAIGTQRPIPTAEKQRLRIFSALSRIQALRTATVGLAKGIQRSFRPFPRQHTCAPAPGAISSCRNAVISTIAGRSERRRSERHGHGVPATSFDSAPPAAPQSLAGSESPRVRVAAVGSESPALVG